ncbi:prostatic acid phosphatase-like [Glandiceps talaboti]
MATSSSVCRCWDVLLVLCLFFGVCKPERTLEMVHVLYRHGNRSPARQYPTDPNPVSTWPQGFGQLTNSGKMQQFKLGQWLLERYGGLFLNKTYMRSEIYVRSTDIDRTLMSAECNLAGMYPPNGEQIWNPDLKMPWQPIPVHTTVNSEDTLIGFPNCPKYNGLADKVRYGEKAKHYEEVNKAFLDLVKEKSGVGFNSTDLWNLTAVSDAVWFETVENKTIPEWVTKDVAKKLKDLMDYTYELMHDNNDTAMRRLSRGVLLNEVVEHMKMKAAYPDNPAYKMYMYSGHDTTVSGFLSAMTVFNYMWPPTASCVIVELHREGTGQSRKRRHGHHHEEPTELPPFQGNFTIDLYYRNDSSEHDPLPLIMKKCGSPCHLEDFMTLTADVRLNSEEWEEECNSVDYGSMNAWWNLQFNLGTVVAAVGIIITVVFFIIFCFGVLIDPLRGKRKKRSLDTMELLLGNHDAGSDDENDLEMTKVGSSNEDGNTSTRVNVIPEPDASNWVEIKN